MIPLSASTHKWKTKIRAVYWLIAVNAIVHLALTLQTDFQLTDYIAGFFGFIPRTLTTLNPIALVTIPASMFLHAGLLHLLGNMLYLFVFGREVEATLGRKNFLTFYLLSGVAADLTHALLYPFSAIPTVGASGAISGVLGAYLTFNPKGWVKFAPSDPILAYFMVRLLYRITFSVPAWVFIPFWFYLQIEGLLGGGYGIAFGAHIGGFLAGTAIALIARRQTQITPAFP